jgi:hypothetical protein
MSFEGPDTRDYQNVVTLNSAYLTLLGSERVLAGGIAGCQGPLRQRLLNLRRTESLRLAETPFLLFSFRERDDRYWDGVLGATREPGLFRSSGSEPVDTLVAAALGFIWQLANRNPYTLRLICGSTLYWCDRIADLTFYGLLDAVRNSGDVPVLRQGSADMLWRKLLGEGVSANNAIRKAAQLASLQAVLTDSTPPGAANESWSLAARSSAAPGLRIDGGRESSER